MSKRIEISPLTRVEGHGAVRVFLDGRRARKVELSLWESPRLFEALLRGKGYQEVPEIICRICSLCSTVHRVVSLLAIEKAIGIEVSEQVRLYRELIVNGGHIQSHALHLFCLVLPDHYGVSGLAGLATREAEVLKMGLRLKAVGNLIQETVGGRLIHPVTLIPGGMGKPVRREELLKLKETLEYVLPDAIKTAALFSTLSPSSHHSPLPLPRFMVVRSDPAVPLFGEELQIGSERTEPVDAYRNALDERVEGYSNAKTSLVEGEPVTVGALARLNAGFPLAPRAMEAFQEYREQIVARDIRANSLAQAVELVHAVERSLKIIEAVLNSDFGRERPSPAMPRSGEGCAAIEAPRGVLIHSYRFNGRGFCSAADVITPTSINQAAIERDLLALAQEMDGAEQREMTEALERVIRAYDPCISCAVHVVRQ